MKQVEKVEEKIERKSAYLNHILQIVRVDHSQIVDKISVWLLWRKSKTSNE